MEKRENILHMRMLYLGLFVVFCPPVAAQTYTISTVAGGAAPPIRVAPATRVSIGGPNSVAVDQRGNVYFASAALHTVFKQDPAGMLTRAAGYSTGGFLGDGGPATSARLLLDAGGYGQGGIAVDAAGNLFIADTGNHRIRKVSADGIITTVAGNGAGEFSGDGGPATDAALRFPTGVAVDGAGNLFIADHGNLRVRKVSVDGTITTVATGQADGLALDRAGNLFIAAASDHVVRRLSVDGSVRTVAGETSVALSYPVGVAVDGSNNLYVADALCQCVRKVPATGNASTIAGTGLVGFSGDGGAATGARLWDPWGVAVDGAGNVFIADRDNHRVRRVSAGGTITTVAGDGGTDATFSGDGGPATLAELKLAIPLTPAGGVAVDSAANVFVADSGNHRVRRISPDGIITTVAGVGTPCSGPNDCLPLGDGGPAASAALWYPSAVAVDAAGNLFIADYAHQRVRKVSPDGTITTVVGPPEIGVLAALTLGAGGNIFIADRGLVRRISSDGGITTVAGGAYCSDEDCPPNGDGGPAVGARVAPTALAIDAAGNLFIADSQATDLFCEHRIRKVSAEGIISTVAGPTQCQDPRGDNALTYTTSLALDPAGNLFVAGVYDHRVRRLSPDGSLSVVAGTGSAGFSGDGGPAKDATLNYPIAVGTDATGNVYVSDAANNAIRVLRPVQSTEAAK